jgi:hypothetical protein
LVVAKVTGRLAVSKRAAQKIHMEILKLKELMKGKLKNNIRLQSQTSLQLWKTSRIMETSTGHGTLLERPSKFRPKSVSVIVKRSIVSHGLMYKTG